MGVPSIGLLPTNLLSLADQDFESGAGSWTAVTNAGTPAHSAFWSFTGNNSLRWTATALGNTEVATGPYPVTAGLPYVTSCIVNPGASRGCFMGIAWFSDPAGITLISSTGGTAITIAPGGGPISFAGVAPVGAVSAKVFVIVVGAAASEVEAIDFVFLAQTSIQVLCDWTNPAFTSGSAAGSAFFDVTPFVRLDMGMDLSRGRQDNVSEVPPGSASFTTLNTMGWFSSDNTNSPWYPGVKLGRRLQINCADETGTWHTRFDGPLAEIDYTFDDQANCYASIIGADVMAWLSRLQSLSCWTRSLVMQNGPSLHWALDDQANSNAVAETSGNGGSPLRQRSYGQNGGSNAASVTFRSGTGGVETQANAQDLNHLGTPSTSALPSAYFQTAKVTGLVGSTSSASAQLEGNITPLSTLTGSNWTLEVWATLDPAAFSTMYQNASWASILMCVFGMMDTRSGTNITFSLIPGSPSQAWFLTSWKTPLTDNPGTAAIASLNVAANLPNGGVPIHFVMTVVGANSGATATLYINGASQGTLALPKAFTPNWLSLGGLPGGYGGWQGNLSLASIYPYALSPSQISFDAVVGQAAVYLNNAASPAQGIGGFAGVPTFWNNLLASQMLGVTDYVDITATSALASLQTIEAVEVAGLLYVNAAGQLMLDGRQVRMGASTPDLTLPAESFTADLGYALTDQFLVTSAAEATPVINRAENIFRSGPINDYGPYPQGTPQAPNTVPVLSLNPQFFSSGVPGHATHLDPYVDDLASWQVYRNSKPRFRPASVTIDLKTLQNPATGPYVAISAVYGVDINKIIRLTGTGVTAFPNAPNVNLDYFIEGVAEHFDQNSHTVKFITTPADIVRCWKPGDATWGVLDQTAYIGISAAPSHANAPNAKNHPADPGPPYWPPTYAAGMNNGGTSGKGFVGATDQRGVFDTLQRLQGPPLCVVGQTSVTQSFGTGSEATVIWDTTFADTVGGFGIVPGFPNYYTVLIPGFYEIEAVVVFAAVANGNRIARLLVNPTGQQPGHTPNGAQALSVASTSRRPVTAGPTAVTLSTRLYCGVGTTIGLRGLQDSGGAVASAPGPANGPLMSIRWTGYSQTAD